MIRIPQIYLDTNVLRDCIKGRNHDSIQLLGKIRDKKWGCVTSVFTFMELLDVEKDDTFAFKKLHRGWEFNRINRERNRKDLTIDELREVYRQVMTLGHAYKFIEVKSLDEKGWQQAFRISALTNLASADVIHLAVAMSSKCNILVTSDDQFNKNGNELLKKDGIEDVIICKVLEVNDKLKSMNFKRID